MEFINAEAGLMTKVTEVRNGYRVTLYDTDCNEAVGHHIYRDKAKAIAYAKLCVDMY